MIEKRTNKYPSKKQAKAAKIVVKRVQKEKSRKLTKNLLCPGLRFALQFVVINFSTSTRKMNFAVWSEFLIKYSLYSIFVYQKLDTNVEMWTTKEKNLPKQVVKSLRSQDYSFETSCFFFKTEDSKDKIQKKFNFRAFKCSFDVISSFFGKVSNWTKVLGKIPPFLPFFRRFWVKIRYYFTCWGAIVLNEEIYI